MPGPSLQRHSCCKINLILNVLGKRPDGFHELETFMHPVALHDTLHVELVTSPGITLTCDHPDLPTDTRNLVVRAATIFFQTSGAPGGVRIHLEKRIPLAAGLGGGSGNAAATLLALNELVGKMLPGSELEKLAGELGSDVPFFLRPSPALATGRGEQIRPVGPFPWLEEIWAVLVHPGFGVSTPWAYRALASFPTALNGKPGLADECLRQLQHGQLRGALALLYNSLEAPVLQKYPLLQIIQEFFRREGALATLMSGSGSTTFALASDRSIAEALRSRFLQQFGETSWTAVVSLSGVAATPKV